MPSITLTQTIARKPADVFRTIVTLDQFPSWNPTVQKAEKITPGAPRDGSRFAFWVRGFGRTEQVLEEFQADKRVRLVPQSPKYSGGHRFTLTPEGKGTRVDHELELEPRGMMRLMMPLLKPMMRKNLDATANALKDTLERPAGK